jgi:hypothetical protein
MNGQTGKIAGDLPVSKAKMAAWFFGMFIVFAIIICLVAIYFAS